MNAYASRSWLVLHADDFGLNATVNQGIVRGFSEGLLTSTSLLVNAPDARMAVAQWKMLDRERGRGTLESTGTRHLLGDRVDPFDLGLHLNLTQGRPLTQDYPAALLDSEGRFPGIGRLFQRLVWGGEKFAPAIEKELAAQWEWMVTEGVPPTHVNGHQYAELLPVVSSLVPALCERFGTRVVRCARESGLTETLRISGKGGKDWLLGRVKRHFADRFQPKARGAGLSYPELFFGTGHAGEVSAAVFEGFMSVARREGATTVEIGLHPGDAPHPVPERELADGWFDPLASGRPLELAFLHAADIVRLIDQAGFRLGRLSRLAEQTERRAGAA
jgi:chitin disaccharide deacetylase